MNVQLFQHPDFGSLTTFKDNDGKEYYKAHDVCIALRLSNPSQQIKRHVKSKWVFEFDDGYSNSGKALYLTEAGFNALIFRSKTPQAEVYQDWVFEEVLPKLRAEGGYIMPTANSEQLAALKEKIEIQEKEIGRVTQLNKEVSEIDAKLAYIIRVIIDQITCQATTLCPRPNSKKEKAYEVYWKSVYRLSQILPKAFPMDLCTKQCFDETLTPEVINEIFNAISLEHDDMTWENNYPAYHTYNMSEH